MADHHLGVYRPYPRGEFDSTRNYKFLDIVTYNGGTYINNKLDTINGGSCIGILPEGQPQSSLYWMKIASKGDKGDMADSYRPYIVVPNGQWDYSAGDKCFIPNTNGVPNTITITNLYDGCCGIIVSKRDLTLPAGSLKSTDFDYVPRQNDGDYYFYTFTYARLEDNSHMLIWHRSVVRRGD